MMNKLLRDHKNGFTYIELNSRRYLAWSVPVYDLAGYEFLVVYGGHTHVYIDVLMHTYANISILRCVNVKTSTIL